MDTKKNQKYVVFSKGVALPGVDESELTSQLSSNYKMSEEKVSTQLLSGKLSKIRSFDDQDKAKTFASKLTELGLSCHLLETDDGQKVDKPAEVHEPSEGDEPLNLGENSKSSAKWLVPTLLIFCLALAAAYYFYSK